MAFLLEMGDKEEQKKRNHLTYRAREREKERKREKETDSHPMVTTSPDPPSQCPSSNTDINQRLLRPILVHHHHDALLQGGGASAQATGTIYSFENYSIGAAV